MKGGYLMVVHFKSDVKFLGLTSKTNAATNSTYYKLSILTPEGSAGQISCSEDAVEACSNLQPMDNITLLLTYCDDYERLSVRVTQVYV